MYVAKNLEVALFFSKQNFHFNLFMFHFGKGEGEGWGFTFNDRLSHNLAFLRATFACKICK